MKTENVIYVSTMEMAKVTAFQEQPDRSQRSSDRRKQEPTSVYVQLDDEGTLSPVYVAVPTLIEVHRPSSAEQLVWRARDDDSVVDARSCLDAFISLADADEQQVRTFARKFGPLLGSRSFRADHRGLEHIEESIPHWRAMANSLLDLLAVASDVLAGRTPVKDEWLGFQLFPENMSRLEAGITSWHRDSMIHRRSLGGEGFVTASSPKEWLQLIRATANDRLESAGVRADSGFGESGTWGATFELPGFRSLQFDPGTGVPIVDGLLPIVVLLAVSAMRDNRVFRCDGCKRMLPLPQGARRPRIGIPFYGDHETCRREARLKTKRESKRRRYWRQRETVLFAESDHEPDGEAQGAAVAGSAMLGETGTLVTVEAGE